MAIGKDEELFSEASRELQSEVADRGSVLTDGEIRHEASTDEMREEENIAQLSLGA